MRDFILAACLFGCLVTSCSPKQPTTTPRQSTSSIGYPTAEATVTICQPVGYSAKPPAGYLVVDGGVAIPVTTPEGKPLQVSWGDFDQEGRWYFDDHGRWLWAKSGLVVWGNTDIEISAPSDSPLRFDWGEEPNLVPRRSLRVECSQKAPQWIALIGGYFANSEGCFPLDIRVGGKPAVQVQIQMGTACLPEMETPFSTPSPFPPTGVPFFTFPVDRHDPESVIRAYFDAWERSDSSALASVLSSKFGQSFMFEPMESLQILEIELISDASSTERVYNVLYDVQWKNREDTNPTHWSFHLTWDANRDSWIITNYGAG